MGLLSTKEEKPKLTLNVHQRIFNLKKKTFYNSIDTYQLFKKYPDFGDLVTKMTCIDPENRIKPKEILEHPFCESEREIIKAAKVEIHDHEIFQSEFES